MHSPPCSTNIYHSSAEIAIELLAEELSKKENILILCGHYEGIDERIIDKYVDEEISVGDFVLTGGEMPAMILSDAISRMIPGVLSEDLCFTEESHFSGLLEHPQYTRPAVWDNMKVPEVLLGGDHQKVENWKREEALKRTAAHRPDMLSKADLNKKDLEFLKKNGFSV